MKHVQRYSDGVAIGLLFRNSTASSAKTLSNSEIRCDVRKLLHTLPGILCAINFKCVLYGYSPEIPSLLEVTAHLISTVDKL